MTTYPNYPGPRRPSPLPLALAGAAFALAAWMAIERAGWLAPAVNAEPRAITLRGELAPLEQTFVDVFERCSPSVAYISTRTLVRDSYGYQATSEGTGSGFVWDDRGIIVTNCHVVDGVQTARVAVGGQTYTADVLNRTTDYDLAVLRLRGDGSKLRPITLGTSKDLRVGQIAIAIGNPFEFDHTLTTGVISALGRSIRTEESRSLTGLIQVDAAINPGNSGGPLLDSAGRLIGVTTAIYSPSGASVGIGFAVPVDTVNEIVPALLTAVRVPVAADTPPVAATTGLPVLGIRNTAGYRYCPVDLGNYRSGAIFTECTEGFGARLAGLQPFAIDRSGNPTTWGDVLVAIDGQRVRTFDDIPKVLRGKQPGQEVQVELVRGLPDAPRLMTVPVTLSKS